MKNEKESLLSEREQLISEMHKSRNFQTKTASIDRLGYGVDVEKLLEENRLLK